MNVSGVILAAGGARRFGGAKQVALYEGQPLVVRAVKTALSTPLKDVIVVIGSYRQEVEKALEGQNIHQAHNADWSSGIASSIRCGVQAAIDRHSDHVLIMLADQPLITSDHLQALLNEAGNASVVATAYSEILGVPALFHARMFDQLLSLSGDRGAGAIIKKCDSVTQVANEAARIDVDTPAQVPGDT